MVVTEAFGLTDTGLSRNHNEDCYGIDAERGLYVVADGMGGHNHGEVASRIAVEAICDFVNRRDGSEDETWPIPYEAALHQHSNNLKAAIHSAHDRVLSEIQRDVALQGMGTTVVGVMVDERTAAIAHVGDSRVYRFRSGKLELLTRDHTWVNEQLLAGFISDEQARSHPLRNVVTRALGGEDDIHVDMQEIELLAGDIYLLCSDGLTTMLRDEEIADLVGGAESPRSMCHRLIEAANSRGGLDNITVVMFRVGERQ